jgi:hypothetical protein
VICWVELKADEMVVLKVEGKALQLADLRVVGLAETKVEKWAEKLAALMVA